MCNALASGRGKTKAVRVANCGTNVNNALHLQLHLEASARSQVAYKLCLKLFK